MDVGGDGAVNPPVVGGRPGNFPDVLEVRWGGWTPYPTGNPTPKKNFNGSFNGLAAPPIVRIDMKFAGLLNPPGPLGVGGVYDPYRFGNSPLYGFIEVDLDGNKDTGGELGEAARQRYLAVTGRFGELPGGTLLGRTVVSGAQLDSSFTTSPQFERSGAEYVVSFCGCFEPSIEDEDDGDCDGVFEPGETWIVEGRFFQRAGGFVAASAAKNGSQPGAYDPVVFLRFSHSESCDTTTVSLVYAVTQSGAAKLRCGSCPAQPINLDVGDDTSIQEAMVDVCEGALSPFFPAEFPETWALVSGWAMDAMAEGALYPGKWVFRAALATAYSEAQPDGYLVWTDVGFDEHFADFNGSGSATMHDRAALVSHVFRTDGTGFDCDPNRAGSVGVCAFGHSFSVFDLDYDGCIDADDAALIPEFLLGDLNGDCAVTTVDLIFFLGRYGSVPGATALTGDLNGDGMVDTADLVRILPRFGSTCP